MARILVVDDVRFISQMIASVFERIGHRVETAADGEEALRKALGSLPDLIVMDVAMPKLDGLEVTRRLRAHDRTRDIPILLVTSRADSGTLTAAAEAGVDDHLGKPFEAPALLAKSARLLGGYPMTFDLELFGESTVVTALPEELGASAGERIRPALEHARSAALGVILLDLSRVARVDSAVADAILAFDEAFRSDGGSLEMVPPKSGLGVRAFLSLVSARLKVHADLDAARRTLGLGAEGTGQPVPPPRRPGARAAPAPASEEAPPPAPVPAVDAPASPAPAAPPAAASSSAPVTRTGAARGVVLETHPQATIVRLHRTELDDEVMDLLRDEAMRSPRAILVDMSSVQTVDERHARAVGELADFAAAAGGSVRVVNPTVGVASALEAVGLASLVLRTRTRDGAATRASS